MHDVVTTPTGLQPKDFVSTAAYVAAVKALGDPPAHADDPSMAKEHAALFALVPRAEATHVAVRNGSWFDPATWSDGRIPDAGAKVLIPEAISVKYDGVSDASLFTVRVDGKLLFAPDHDTRMVVDTLVVAKTGLLQIGTDDHPIQDCVTANIVIADNGPIDVNWDPMLLSRGIISHGSTEIHGQEKTSFLKLAMDPVAGSTLLHLDEDAVQNGWKVGDKIVVTGTHIGPQLTPTEGWVDIGSQDEVRTIKGIYGSTIVLDQALAYNHDSPRADLKAYVADYTRNVVIETQYASELPPSQRGHVMFMHSPSVDVENAEFYELGRTDKSTRAVDAATATDITSDTNVKGRYAFHLHETGVGPLSPETIVKGNAIWGSPGWGIVQHASSADIENNATFNTFGAAYVAETGDETGLWRNNIAIQAHGIGAGPWVDKSMYDVAAFDLARTGIGFYFQGRMIDVTDNVAAGVNEGFVYMVRGTPAKIDANNLDQPEILHGASSSDVAAAPIQNFTDNEVLAAAYGFIVVKANPAQGHDVRSVIDGFKAWETDIGIHLEYTAHYTFLDADLVGPDVGRGGAKGTSGIELGNNTFDIVINRANIANYQEGIVLAKVLTSNSLSPSDLNYVIIDLKTQDIQNNAIKNFDPLLDKQLASGQLVSGPAGLTMSWSQIPVWDFAYPDGRSVKLAGVKTDSIGQIKYANGSETFTIGLEEMAGILSHQGYYTTPDGRKIVLLEEYFSDRATGEIFKTSIPIQIAENVPLLKSRWYMLDRDAISLGHIDLNAPAPVAFSDTASTTAGKSVVIDVLHNDVDLRNLVMKVDGTTQPVHGTVTANSDGTLTYKPDGDFTGVDTFKYWLTDKNGKFDDGFVTVTVGARSGTEGGDTPGHSHDPGDDGGHDHDGHGHDPDLPPEVPAPPTSPLPAPGHAHDHDDRINDRDPGRAHDTGVPSVPEVPSPAATPPAVPVFDRAGASDFRSWQQFNVQLSYDEKDWVGYGMAGLLKAGAGSLEAYAVGWSGYDPSSSPSAAYGDDFAGVRKIGEHLERAFDQPSPDHGVVAPDANPFSMGNTLTLHLESSASELALPVSDGTDPAFSFRDLATPDVDASHHAGVEMRPLVEHLGGVASGFIFA